jgi:uncharacterized protein
MSFKGGIAALLFCLILCGASVADSAPEPLSAFAQTVLSVRTHAGNVHNFKIWIADRPARQEQGLMYIRQLDDYGGMLFVFPDDRDISMWMKNTYIPLDMLFLRADGRIDSIVAAIPQSLDIIASRVPVRAVLELNAGTAKRLDIVPGDRVFCDVLPGGPSKPRK